MTQASMKDLEAKNYADWGVTSTAQQNADASMHFHRSWS